MTTSNLGPTVIPDDNEDDRDSSIGDDLASSTQSISSSIIDYRRENGRTYHQYKDGKYNLPNDEIENDRLDLQHHLFLLTFDDKLGLSPPNDPKSKVKRVLDVGTGTGIWAMDYADEHPETEVVGIDLSPIQPSFVPPNVRFIIDDLEEDWSDTKKFDYIHSRAMAMSIGDWKEYLRKCFDNLTPGGYVELQEVDIALSSDDNSLTDDYQLSKCWKLLKEAFVKLGRPFPDFNDLRTMMTEVGFTEVTDSRFKWPINTWPKDKKFKEIGALNYENEMNGLEALTIAPFTRGYGWTKEEVDVFLIDVRKDFSNLKIHAYWPVCSIYGKKPAE